MQADGAKIFSEKVNYKLKHKIQANSIGGLGNKALYETPP